MRNAIRSAVLLLLFVTGAAFAAEWYVDNAHGDDANPGTAERPFRTFAHCLEVLKGGDTLNLVPNEQPYTEQFGHLTSRYSGTPDHPTVIDGHGARLTGMTRIAPDKWKDEGNGVFSLRFQNNVVTMSGQGYYSGYPFVFVDGQPLPPVKTMDDLVPNSCFMVLKWYPKLKLHDPLHNMLYIRLAEGKTPANTVIEAPRTGALAAQGSFMTIRNIVAEWNAADNFDAAHGKGIVFENIDSSFCMDQCLSSHSVEEAQVRFCRFSRAIDGGVLDVSYTLDKPCHVRYLGCLFEDNIQLGGAGFKGGKGSEYVMDSCVIRNNERHAVFAQQFAKVTLRNCFILKGEANASCAVAAFDSARIELENCTISGFENVFSVRDAASIKATNCKFIDCGKTANSDASSIEVVPGDSAGSSLNPTVSVRELRQLLEQP